MGDGYWGIREKDETKGRQSVANGPSPVALALVTRPFGVPGLFLGQANALMNGREIAGNQDFDLLGPLDKRQGPIASSHGQRAPILRATAHDQKLKGGAIRVHRPLQFVASCRQTFSDNPSDRARVAVNFIGIDHENSCFVLHWFASIRPPARAANPMSGHRAPRSPRHSPRLV